MYNTQITVKIQLNAIEYNNFITNYWNSTVKTQRLGQAFFNHFELNKIQIGLLKDLVNKLYELDGKEAKEFIEKHFEFI